LAVHSSNPHYRGYLCGMNISEAVPIKRILGIDPGTNILGYAILDATKKDLVVVEIGVVTFAHITEDQTEKLKYIFEQVQDIIQTC
jgi:crossover junction endodeoxyribonuclease RuvC